jgi:hypothetical protein
LGQSKQEQKYMLSLAGEFLVAGELLRRNMTAAVTYGNAKRADVVAVSGRSAVPIEVKTTRGRRCSESPIGRQLGPNVSPPYPPVACVTPNWTPEPCENREASSSPYGPPYEPSG